MTDRGYSFKLARSTADVEAYFELRHLIFCQEQALFTDHDRDEIDAVAYPIVAIDHRVDSAIHLVAEDSTHAATSDLIVGVVRIYEPEPGLWYGGRLGVHQDYRRAGRIGKGLIHKAVTTANTWGCDRFLATVQLQNVRFFQRLHWQSLEEVMICDRPHHLMEADLNHYPPGVEPRPVLQKAS